MRANAVEKEVGVSRANCVMQVVAVTKHLQGNLRVVSLIQVDAAL
jgi:hypothetical protein